jgi:hypothetical protein
MMTLAIYINSFYKKGTSFMWKSALYKFSHDLLHNLIEIQKLLDIIYLMHGEIIMQFLHFCLENLRKV